MAKEKCTHNNCFTCPYADCIEDSVRTSDAIEIRERDKRWRNGATAYANVPTARKKKKKLCKI